MAEHLSSTYVAQRLHQLGLFYFTPSLLADLLSLKRRQTYRLIARLKDEGLVDEVEKGKYLLLGLEPEQVLSNPLFIASHLVTPAYVSYWSALHYYGFTEQVPLTTFVATTKKKRPVTFIPPRVGGERGGTTHSFRFRFVTIKPHKFFGYRREMLGDLPVVVADEAKAIVDSLDLPHYAGGVIEIAKALQAALETVDVPTLVSYANRMEDKSLGSRLGYLLETLGCPAEGLISSVSPIKLDPSRPRIGCTDARWQVVANISEAEMMPQGVG
jgi:predicted transcriptional regulator of viral defense system